MESPRHPLLSFTLNETEAALAERFDRAAQVAQGPGFRVLQFHALRAEAVEPLDWVVFNANACAGKFAYTASYREGRLRSILFQPEKPTRLQYFFPKGTYTEREVVNSIGIRVTYRLRKLSGDRLLIAPIAASDIQLLDQLVLTRPSEIPALFPLLTP